MSQVWVDISSMEYVSDDSQPEASDDIALWLADEFTQVRGTESIFPGCTAKVSGVAARKYYGTP